MINNIDNSCNHINIPNPDIIIYTDLIYTDWEINYGVSSSRGLLNKAEVEHINVLELNVIEMGICTYCKNNFFFYMSGLCVITSQLFVNNMGWGHKSSNL